MTQTYPYDITLTIVCVPVVPMQVSVDVDMLPTTLMIWPLGARGIWREGGKAIGEGEEYQGSSIGDEREGKDKS